MGQRGPKPRSQLKLIPGRSGPTRTGKRVRRGRPDRPPELTGEAAREWDRVADDLDAAGTLSPVDRGILAAYCLAVADMLAARNEINRDGRFIRTPVQTSRGELVGKRITPHPAVRMLEGASARVSKLAADLGLTPTSRTRIEGDGPGEAPAGNRVLELRERIAANRANPAG